MIGYAYAAGESAGLPQFEVEHYTAQTFWAVISFVVLLILLHRFVLPRFQKLLDERSRMVQEELEQAAEQRKQAEFSAAEYRAKLDAAEAEVQAMVRKSREEEYRHHDEVMAELKLEMERKKASFMEEVEFSKQQALKDIRHAATDIAMTATEKLIAKHVSEDDVEHMVDEAIHDIESGKRKH